MFDEITVEEVSADKKLSTAREILEALPDWFGIPESREQYIKRKCGTASSANAPFIVLFEDHRFSVLCGSDHLSLLRNEKRMHTVRLFLQGTKSMITI